MSNITSALSGQRTIQLPMASPEALTAKLASIASISPPPAHVQPPEFGTWDEQACISIKSNWGSEKKELFKTNRFFLESIKKELLERFQITELFNQSVPAVEFFGSRVKTYEITGLVLSASAAEPPYEKYLWDDQLRYLYDTQLRATALTKNNNIGVLSYSKNQWLGYPISLSFSENANNPYLKQFSMQWLVLTETLSGVNPNNYDELFRNTSALTKGNSELEGKIEKYKKLVDEADKLAAQLPTSFPFMLMEPLKDAALATLTKKLNEKVEEVNRVYAEIDAAITTKTAANTYGKWD